MASGRNDVEFSIGADNSQLGQDLLEGAALFQQYTANIVGELNDIEAAGAGMESAFQSVGDTLGLANTQAGELLTSAGRLAGVFTGAATAALAIYDAVIKAVRESSGLNRELKEAIELKKQIDEESKNSTAKSIEDKSLAQLKEQLEIRQKMRNILEKNLSDAKNEMVALEQTRDDMNSPVGEIDAAVERIERLNEMMEGWRSGLDAAKENVETVQEAVDKEQKRFDKSTEAGSTAARVKFFEQQVKEAKEESDAMDEAQKAKEKRDEEVRQGSITAMQRFFKKQQEEAKAEADAMDKAEKEREKELERLDPTEQIKTKPQLEAMRKRLETLQGQGGRALGGFDRGLDSISDRIADAASQDPLGQDMKKLAEEQVELQSKLVEETIKTNARILELNAGGMTT